MAKDVYEVMYNTQQSTFIHTLHELQENLVPQQLSVCIKVMSTDSVSYTHLRLPTNREV